MIPTVQNGFWKYNNTFRMNLSSSSEPIAPSTSNNTVTPRVTPQFVAPATKVIVKKLGFRSGLFGFLIGSVIVGLGAFEYFIQEQTKNHQKITVLLHEFSKQHEQSKERMKQFDVLNGRLDKLASEQNSKVQAQQTRRELLQLFDNVHGETLELKYRLYELEQQVSRKATNGDSNAHANVKNLIEPSAYNKVL